MKKVAVYSSFDGILFLDRNECSKHETTKRFLSEILPVIKKFFPVKYQENVLRFTGNGMVLYEFFRYGRYDTIHFGKLLSIKDVVYYCFKNDFPECLTDLNKGFSKSEKKLKAIMLQRNTAKYFREALHMKPKTTYNQ